MADNQMWFGTREHMQFIPCPDSGADFSSIGWSTDVVQYLNGGAYIRNSATAHKQYDMSWNMANRRDLQPLYDYAAGVYGPAPYYFIDPMAADQNVLPEWWATPSMALTDAPLLVGETTPQLINTPTNSLNYPTSGVLYTVSPTDARQTLYLPIPPGQAVWVGVHGLASSAASIYLSIINNGVTVSGFSLPMLNVADTTRFSSTLSAVSGIELSVAGTGSLGLYGIMAQVLDIGVTPESGGFVGGQGHSGVQFSGKPTRMAYSSVLDLAGAAATLVETGGWSQ